MAAWIKINRPNVEVGSNFVLFQALVVDMDKCNGFAVQNKGTVSFFLEGNAFTVNRQSDQQAYKQILDYVKHRSGKELP